MAILLTPDPTFSQQLDSFSCGPVALQNAWMLMRGARSCPRSTSAAIAAACGARARHADGFAGTRVSAFTQTLYSQVLPATMHLRTLCGVAALRWLHARQRSIGTQCLVLGAYPLHYECLYATHNGWKITNLVRARACYVHLETMWSQRFIQDDVRYQLPIVWTWRRALQHAHTRTQ